jgi:hypothetical protein
MLWKSMAVLKAVFSSGDSVIHTASYGPSVKKPWWNLTPHDSAVFMFSCILPAASLDGGWEDLTRVTNHIVVACGRVMYIRRRQNLASIGELDEVKVVCASLCRLWVFPRRMP